MRLDHAIRRGARSIVRLGVLLETAGEYCARFLLLRARGPIDLRARAQWLHESCRAGLSRLSISVETQGKFPPHGLLVANHLSYLDILVLSGIAPCVFVAKKEVRSWPIFGLMARMAGTVFIDRSRSADAVRVNDKMLEALSAGAVVVLFPEGTSSNGATVLPFRPALFEGAVQAGQPIAPAHLRYEVDDGSVENDVCYWGSATFFPHLLRLLARKGLRAIVRVATSAVAFDDRKLAARETHKAVLALAGLPPKRAEGSQQADYSLAGSSRNAE